MKTDYIKGNTPDEKFKSLERHLQYLYPRAVNKVVGAIPPILIFADRPVLDETGMVFRKIFPIPGTINTIALAMDKESEKETVEFVLTVIGTDKVLRAHTFTVTKSVNIVDVSYEINSGDIVSLTSNNQNIKNICVGAVMNIPLRNIKKERILMEEPEDAI